MGGGNGVGPVDFAAAVEAVVHALVTEDDDTALHAVLRATADLTGSDHAAVAARLNSENLVVRAVTPGLERMIGRLLPSSAGSLSGTALRTEQARWSRGPFPTVRGLLPDVQVGAVAALPLVDRSGLVGLLYAGRRPGRPDFTAADLDLGRRLAELAALAIEVVGARDESLALDQLEQGRTTAVDLGDRAIQRLYAVGMGLSALAPALDDAAAGRLESQLKDLHAVAEDLRTVVDTLGWPDHHRGQFAHRLQAAALSAERESGRHVEIAIDDRIEELDDSRFENEVVDAVRSLLSLLADNGDPVTVAIDTHQEVLTAAVAARGPQARINATSPGLIAARRAARRCGGSLQIARHPDRVELRWTAPLPARASAG